MNRHVPEEKSMQTGRSCQLSDCEIKAGKKWGSVGFFFGYKWILRRSYLLNWIGISNLYVQNMLNYADVEIPSFSVESLVWLYEQLGGRSFLLNVARFTLIPSPNGQLVTSRLVLHESQQCLCMFYLPSLYFLFLFFPSLSLIFSYFIISPASKFLLFSFKFFLIFCNAYTNATISGVL